MRNDPSHLQTSQGTTEIIKHSKNRNSTIYTTENLLSFFFFFRGSFYTFIQVLTIWHIEPESCADGDCNHEIKRSLLLGRKVMTNLDSMLKSRDINLPTKVHLVKSMVFPVVMYGYESWTIKKAER